MIGSGGKKKSLYRICCRISQSAAKFVNDRQTVGVCSCLGLVLLTALVAHSAVCTQTHGSCTGEDSVSEPTQSTWVHEQRFVTHTCTENHINQQRSSNQSTFFFQESSCDIILDCFYTDIIPHHVFLQPLNVFFHIFPGFTVAPKVSRSGLDLR